MPSGHLMFKEEAAFGTWLAPSAQGDALPVIGSGIGAGADQPLLNNESTGLQGRARQAQRPGVFTVGGPVTTLFWPQQMGYLLRSLLPTRASVAAGTGFKTKMLPDDDAANDSFSLQERHNSSMGYSSKGAKINTATLRAAVGEYAQWELAFLAQDGATSGGTWTDGSAAPAVIDPATLYIPSQVQPFTFYEAVVRLGGTVALTSGELVVSGGTARNDFDDISVEFNFNLADDAFGVNLGNRTRQQIPEGARDITVNFSPNVDTIGSNGKEFYDAFKAGSLAVVELYFQHAVEFDSGEAYEAKLTLPAVKYSAGALPEINRSYGLRRTPISGVAEAEAVTGYDWGLTYNSEFDLSA